MYAGQINHRLTLESNASAPSSPIEGDVYYNSTDHEFYFYNGTEWVVSI